MALEDILGEVAVENAWSHIELITTQMPSRLAGSANARRMAEYAHSVLEQAGLESRLQEFLGLVSFPQEAAVRLLSPAQRDITAFTLGHSASTDGLEGELIYVGSGAEAEYKGKDVRGKITLSELSYSPARHEKAYIAWQRGASAQIMMNWGAETNEAVPFGSMKSAWGNPTPETVRTEMPNLPCVGIARTEGLRLKALCAQGPVRVWLRARAENGWQPLTMPSAEFGGQHSQQFVLLGGHMDSWFGPQATDNAAGNACIMELARVLAHRRDELRRGLVVGLWVGHETGTMVSSTRFADLNWDRLRRSCVGYLQIDQPAIAGSSTWRLHSTDDVQAYVVRATRAVASEMPVHWHRQQKTGDSSFFGVGLPCLAGEMTFTEEEIQRTALANLGWWHHSVHNTLDKVDKSLLALHLRVYARWLYGLLSDPILPYEYLPLATRCVERLGELSRLAVPGIDLASAVERAREFQQLAAQLDEQTRAWRARAASAQEGEKAASLLNEAMIRLSRTLVPLASTVVGPYGQDRYGDVRQTQIIPSLAPYPTLADYPQDAEEFQTCWVAMVRARNRVVDGLEEASSVVHRVLKELS